MYPALFHATGVGVASASAIIPSMDEKHVSTKSAMSSPRKRKGRPRKIPTLRGRCVRKNKGVFVLMHLTPIMV